MATIFGSITACTICSHRPDDAKSRRKLHVAAHRLQPIWEFVYRLDRASRVAHPFLTGKTQPTSLVPRKCLLLRKVCKKCICSCG